MRKELTEILLKDHTTGGNILWATDSHGSPTSQIDVEASSTIKPRVEKVRAEQKARTKKKAEVFTPTWIIKKMVDEVDKDFKGLALEEYTGKTWLEITCGEGPYICSRYDTVTGESLTLDQRVGFLDRKLQRISSEVDDHDEWTSLAVLAYQASYEYEYQGDSLFLARKNLLLTFIDYYEDKFGKSPAYEHVKEIANIISYNLFQMDGLKYTVPNTDIKSTIKDWAASEMVTFESMSKKN